jgi:hypothetical protein
MSERKISEVMNMLRGFGVITSFNGSFTQGIIEEIGEAIRNYMKGEHLADESVMYDVFSVYIEQSQNIKNYFCYKHALNISSIEKLSYESILLIGFEDSKYYVMSGNVIESEDAVKLEERLETINRMTMDEVKKQYRAVLRATNDSTTGAGLGFLDLRKKSCSSLQYEFKERNDGNVYFILKTVMSQ